MHRHFLARLAAGRAMIMICAAITLTGCGSVVYKESAAGYVSAGRAVTKSLADGSLALAQARDSEKAKRVVADAQCPIGSTRVFLRSSAATIDFAAAVRTTPGAAQSSDCKSLAACGANPAAAACTGACYSASEGNCIAFLDDEAARTPEGVTLADADVAARRALRARIAESEYGRVAAVQSELIKTNLTALTEYLDLLAAVAAPAKPQPASEAKSLADKLTNANDKVKKFTGAGLSDGDQAVQTKVTNILTGAEKLIDDLRQIAREAADADKIKKIVQDGSGNVDGLIDSLKDVAVGDATLAATTTSLSNLKARLWLQRRYAEEPDPYQRSLLLDERARYAIADKAQREQAVNALFAAMKESHATLVRLVQSPSDADRQARAQAALREFKTIAGDLASLLALFG